MRKRDQFEKFLEACLVFGEHGHVARPHFFETVFSLVILERIERGIRFVRVEHMTKHLGQHFGIVVGAVRTFPVIFDAVMTAHISQTIPFQIEHGVCERQGIDHWIGEFGPAKLSGCRIHEADIERGIMGDEHCIPDPAAKLVKHVFDRSGRIHVALVDVGEIRDIGRDRSLRIDEHLLAVDHFPAAHFHGTEFDDLVQTIGKTGRLEVEYDVFRVFETAVIIIINDMIIRIDHAHFAPVQHLEPAFRILLVEGTDLVLGHREGLNDLMIADRDRIHAPVIRGLDILFDRAYAIHFRKIGVHMPFGPLDMFGVPSLWGRDLFQRADHERVGPRIRIINHLAGKTDEHSLFNGFDFFDRMALVFKPLGDHGFLIVGNIEHLQRLAALGYAVVDLKNMSFHADIVHSDFQVGDLNKGRCFFFIASIAFLFRFRSLFLHRHVRNKYGFDGLVVGIELDLQFLADAAFFKQLG